MTKLTWNTKIVTGHLGEMRIHSLHLNPPLKGIKSALSWCCL